MATASPRYKRVLLKISGEALMGQEQFGISQEVLNGLSAELEEIHGMGVELALVVGGGNFFRGAAASEMDRVAADQVGPKVRRPEASLSLSSAMYPNTGAPNKTFESA